MNVIKHIGYAYATSDIAKDQGFYNTGCWYCSVGRLNVIDRVQLVDFSSEDKAEVLKYAESLPYNYGIWSMHENQ